VGKTTTVRVSRRTLERLKAYGRKGETYDQLINRLLDLVDPRRRR